jgi:hypothetical protein
MNSTRSFPVRTYLCITTALILSVHAEGSSRVFGSTETSTIPRIVAEQELLVPLYALVLGLTGAIVIVLLLLSIFALSAFSRQSKASFPEAATAPNAPVLSKTLSSPPPSPSPIRQAMATTTEAKAHAQSEEKEHLQSQPQYVAVKATRKLRVTHHVGADGVQVTASTLPSPSTSAAASFAPTEFGMQGSKSALSLGLTGQELDREFPYTTPTHRAVQRKLRVDLSGGNVRTYSVSPTRKT